MSSVSETSPAKRYSVVGRIGTGYRFAAPGDIAPLRVAASQARNDNLVWTQ